MQWLVDSLTEGTLLRWEEILAEYFFLFSLVFLVFELVRYFVQKRLNWNLIGDTATNFVTQVFFIGSLILLYTFYVSTFAFFSQFAVFDIGISVATLLICIVLADLMYYWEHRFSHRVAAAWATHTVHHSSPHFNISVAYRFGPMDGFWTVFFQIPLVLVGFNPFMVILSEAIVLLYQTALHTEVIKKLPRPIEAVMNTPSHHRVHHGSNERYIDKNYAGMFIIWDRLFGTFAEEKEPVIYGITEPVNSVNPFVVFLHGFVRLWRQLAATPGFGNKMALLFQPPDWQPAEIHVKTVANTGGTVQ